MKTSDRNTPQHPPGLKDLGETGIIEAVRSKGKLTVQPHVIQGIDDDCAVLRFSDAKDLLVTTDTMVEGTHFTAQTLPPEALGWKSLATNLSDIAAMGGTPKTAFLSLGLNEKTPKQFLDDFLKGFFDLARLADIVLAGGDTVATPAGHVISLTLLGECPRNGAVYRSGARPGDDIWVTGCLGNAAGGLFLLKEGLFEDTTFRHPLISAHQRPNPRLKAGKELAESGLIHAMIDLSDGISRDLSHICRQSGTGATLDGSAVPMSDALEELGRQTGRDPRQWALHGGEDYELLFTAPPRYREQIRFLRREMADTPLHRVGRIVAGTEISLVTEAGVEAMRPQGFTHFSGTSHIP